MNASSSKIPTHLAGNEAVLLEIPRSLFFLRELVILKMVTGLGSEVKLALYPRWYSHFMYSTYPIPILFRATNGIARRRRRWDFTVFHSILLLEGCCPVYRTSSRLFCQVGGIEIEDRSTKHPKTRKRSTQGRKRRTLRSKNETPLNSKTKHSRSKTEHPIFNQLQSLQQRRKTKFMLIR